MSARDLRITLLSVLCVAGLALLPAFSCNKGLIDGVAFKVEPNIETAKIQLNFSRDVQTDLGGTFGIANNGRDYGTIEVEPSTPDSPFNVGFRLNLAIVNDQDYVKLDPVDTLPSGQAIPIPNLNRKMARIKLANQVNPNFDVYAYVDVADNGKEWVGLALTLKFLNNKYFPAGLSVSQGFVKDKQGRNQIVAAVFGPKVDDAGNMTVPGGIALFGNLKTLIAGGAREGRQKAGRKMYIFDGKMGPYYDTHPREAFNLEQAFKTLIRENSYGRQLN